MGKGMRHRGSVWYGTGQDRAVLLHGGGGGWSYPLVHPRELVGQELEQQRVQQESSCGSLVL